MAEPDTTRALSDDDRRAVRVAVVLAKQKLRSATLLWSTEEYAEGFRLAREGIAQARRALDLANERAPHAALADDGAGAPAAPGWQGFLAALGASPSDLAAVAEAETIAATDAAPALNGDFEPRHEGEFQRLVAGGERIIAPLGRVAAAPRRFAVPRRVWIGAAAALVAIVLALSLTSRGKRLPPEARASAHYGNNPRFVPRHVMDKNPQTEWLLNTRTSGWVEVTTGGDATVKAVKLLNSRNPPHNDRATINFHVECFRGDKVVATAKGGFGALSANPQWLRVPISARNVDRVRVTVDSFHGLGGGLAELDWE